ncbi:MAG TPA: alpha/beta hydrolase fold domain-containing protein [Paraburkholderia sp.]|uniref:alpha/beta hydrolase fold domain-containing protein n=1 Tax=Paraburkholderia sp. TaxID=1926495 RepID=UPI002B49B720|nr:alpha/beta hydrolase fold domain-containing protein [Paraburkholderia sp.]HKR44413.1 alpha/beta hydrolase fold domain-containing protein [Paraburkholderia sp.]
MMSIGPRANLIEVRHSLSDDDREAARASIERTQRLFNEFHGTMREAYDAMTAQTPVADSVGMESIANADAAGWWLRPRAAPAHRAILFLHGGAFVLGSASGYRGFASQIAVRAGVDTFVLDYPLAPEHPFPAAHDAVLAALRWLANGGIREVALVGDSAGGGLALAALGVDERRTLNIASVAAFSPWVDLALTGPSFHSDATRDAVLTRPVLANAAAAYLGAADPADGRASPLHAIPGRLPPIALQVGTDELLFDDARRYAAAAAEQGATVQLEIYEGLHHVFQRSTHELSSARYALDEVARFISRYWTRDA